MKTALKIIVNGLLVMASGPIFGVAAYSTWQHTAESKGWTAVGSGLLFLLLMASFVMLVLLYGIAMMELGERASERQKQDSGAGMGRT